MNYEYVFTMGDGSTRQFRVEVDRPPAAPPGTRVPAAWTALQFKQCFNCPLNPDQVAYCPAALDFEEIANRFRDANALESVTVEVKTAERTYVKYCDVQTGLRALLGLVMATSACPITAQMKSLAYYHLPFATTEETLFRAVSAFLMKQYFLKKDGGEPDLQLAGLNRLYTDLGVVNHCFKARLDAAGQKDANINAINTLNFQSAAVASSLEDALRDLRPKFEHLLG
jgi:hypothetical protein